MSWKRRCRGTLAVMDGSFIELHCPEIVISHVHSLEMTVRISHLWRPSTKASCSHCKRAIPQPAFNHPCSSSWLTTVITCERTTTSSRQDVQGARWKSSRARSLDGAMGTCVDQFCAFPISSWYEYCYCLGEECACVCWPVRARALLS